MKEHLSVASLAAAGAVLAAVALGSAPAPAAAAVRATGATVAKPPAGYTPIKTGAGMCLDDTGGIGRNGQPVQIWKCLGNANQAWRAEPDGTIRNANGYCLGAGTAANHYAGTGNGTRVVMVSCSASALGSYWTISAFAQQIVSKYAGDALDNRYNGQHDGNPVALWDPANGSPQAKEWTAVPSGGGAPVVTPGQAPDLHVDHANMATAADRVFVPRGFTLSTLEFAQPYLDAAGVYPSVLAETEAEIDAIAGAWHGNTVRLQIEQDTLVQDEAAGDGSYLDLIRAVVSYAQSKGLVVVLNAQTEQVGLEPLPTQATVQFWHLLQPYYGNDRSVIIDVFNEPRPLTGTTVAQYMSLWRNGGTYEGVSYLGHEKLAQTLRAGGYASNMLWVEPPGNDGLAGLTPSAASGTPSRAVSPSPSASGTRQALAVAQVEQEAALKATADPATFLLSGISNVSYSFHHPTVLGTARTVANWNAQFGDLVKEHELSVDDGEWATRAEYTGYRAANGDSGPCWSDAPTAVPRYLTYLQQLGVGMTVWTLSDGEPGIGTTAGSDPGTFTTTATMAHWPGCAADTPVDGPGALLMAYFARQAG